MFYRYVFIESYILFGLFTSMVYIITGRRIAYKSVEYASAYFCLSI